MKKVITFGIVFFVLIALVGCSTPAPGTVTQSPAVATQIPTIAPTAPEHGTTAYVDYIVFKGKADAENATEVEIQEAYNYIKNNFNDFFRDNDTMEKVMYYGAILEYGSDDYSQLGMDAVQAVKYVYRGAESINDAATQENLRQVKKALGL